MERFAFRPLRNASFLTLLFSSFALSVIIQNVFRAAVSPRTKGIEGPSLFIRAVNVGPLSVSWLSIITIVVGVACLLALTLFMRRSLAGIGMRAAAENFSVARLMGVKANRVIALAFVISGLLAGVAGVLWVSRSGSVDPGMGFTPDPEGVHRHGDRRPGQPARRGPRWLHPGGRRSVLHRGAADQRRAVQRPVRAAAGDLILYFKPNGLLAPVAERA